MQHSCKLSILLCDSCLCKSNSGVVCTDHHNYDNSLPSIWCEAQLEYTASVTFEDGVVLALSVNIPQVYRTHKNGYAKLKY